MSRLTFVNLPVKDVAKAREFFTAIGFEFNDQFADENTNCMVISEQAYVMLHAEPTFEMYAEGAVADPATAREVLLGVSADSRADVDDLIAKIAAAGGTTGDLVDQGPMYMQPFHDIDGHRWSVTYMDMSAFAE
ncbi:MAG: VOC family protein [Nocardioidaceae bacterium]